MRFVLATRNRGKAREFGDLLAPHQVLALPDEVALPPETGTTFDENALQKARAACERTGLPALGDDSGLECDALAGAPGVYSARYAGARATDEQNVALLLSRAPAGARCRFVCALAYVHPDGTELIVHGRCEGTLVDAPRGAGGFGYDPVFVPVEYPQQTMAELADSHKHSISHRGRAVRSLRETLGV